MAEAPRAFAAARSLIAELASAVPDERSRALFLERARREAGQTAPLSLPDADG